MKMVRDARSAWKWLSIQIAAVGVALQAGVMAFPGLKDWLGDTATHVAGLLILFGIVAGRMIDQDKKRRDNDGH